jgi:hypothetical protein
MGDVVTLACDPIRIVPATGEGRPAILVTRRGYEPDAPTVVRRASARMVEG